MTTEVSTYTMLGKKGEEYEIPAAVEVAPGLYVFRLPGDLALNNPCRWQIGHHSGRIIAESMRREAAVKGVEYLVGVADWTREPAFLSEEVNERELFMTLSRLDCVPPNSEYMRGDVSSNGTYTDADIEKAVAEYVECGYNALEILVDMSHRVPWIGLDTEPFNEAHDRIVRLADAD